MASRGSASAARQTCGFPAERSKWAWKNPAGSESKRTMASLGEAKEFLRKFEKSEKEGKRRKKGYRLG
jgi:hypothetical protein